DGIRVRNVTGVQTCALPIFRFVDLRGKTSPRLRASGPRATSRRSRGLSKRRTVDTRTLCSSLASLHAELRPEVCALAYFDVTPRSEERRVGKESEDRGRTYK